MKRTILSTLFLGLVVFFLSGCGSSLQIIKPAEAEMIPQGVAKTFEIASVRRANDVNIPDDIIRIVDAQVQEKIRKAGLATNPGNLLIQVEVKGFRQRGAFTRVFWGVLAGADWVEAQVRVLDRQSNRTIGEAFVRSSNATTLDFSFTASMFGEKVVEYLKGL